MKTVADKNSFNAYSGTRDAPRGAVTRRREKPEEPPRKSRKGLVVGLLSLVAIAVVVLLSQYLDSITAYVNRPVSTVKMENALQRVNERDVREGLARHLQDGFFGINVQEIKLALESEPWIESATVTRVWPDAVSVRIREEVAIARWGEEGLLNQYGETFVPESLDEQQSLPQLSGPDGLQHRVMEQYQVFNQMLVTSGLRIHELELSERGSWMLRLDTGVVVTIGRSDVRERLQRFITLHDRHLYSQMNEIEALDLRYHNGISVKKKAVLPDGIAAK